MVISPAEWGILGGRMNKQTARAQVWAVAPRQDSRRGRFLNCIFHNSCRAFAESVIHLWLQTSRKVTGLQHLLCLNTVLSFSLPLLKFCLCRTQGCSRLWHNTKIALCFVVDLVSNPLHKAVRQRKTDLLQNFGVVPRFLSTNVQIHFD